MTGQNLQVRGTDFGTEFGFQQQITGIFFDDEIDKEVCGTPCGQASQDSTTDNIQAYQNLNSPLFIYFYENFCDLTIF